jgi:hypothetical protein
MRGGADVPENVTLRYGAARGGEPLTEAEADRLRQLTSRSARTTDEQYELGGLRARARSSESGRKALEDANHRRPQPGSSKGSQATVRAVSDAVGEAVGKAVVDAVDRVLDREGW